MPVLSNLKYGHPFPIQDEDVVAMAHTAVFFPSYIRWQIRIASYGLLVEHVCTSTSQGEVFHEHIVELPESLVDALLQQSVSMDFHSFPESFDSQMELFPSHCLTIAIRWNGVLKRVVYHIGADREGLQGILIERFMKLWHLIETHAPFTEASIPRERTKRQLKMDARRLKHQKQSPDE